jgi:hypothetical protein
MSAVGRDGKTRPVADLSLPRLKVQDGWKQAWSLAI